MQAANSVGMRMNFFTKLLLAIVALVTLSLVLVSVLILTTGNSVIVDLARRNAELELDFFYGRVQEEVELLESLGIADAEFYRDTAQQTVLGYAARRVVPGGFLFVRTTSGAPVYVPQAVNDGHLVSTRDVAPWEWTIGVAVSDAYLGSFLRASLVRASLLLSLLLVPVVLVSMVLARRVSRPLVALEQGASRLGAGDLSARVDVRSQDEVGRLASTFNQMAVNLEHLTEELEDLVAERTSRLRASLEELKETQSLLVQRERMASLGSLVAGITHEINTPLGVCVTSSSHLSTVARELASILRTRSGDPERAVDLTDQILAASTLIEQNLGRAHGLLATFKQLAVDQSSEQRRVFQLEPYIHDAVRSLGPEVERIGADVVITIPETIVLESYPGLVYQVLTNLIMNSVIHAFGDTRSPQISIEAAESQGELTLTYRDNGSGMPSVTARRAFEPFFTTRLGQGGSGLGLSIVYNLVHRDLNGTITLDTAPGEGVTFTIRMPTKTEPTSSEPTADWDQT